jgi:UDPglucose 6-dehydrogenase
MKEKLLIGFIGQGFIGKNYAADFEARGYSVIRYSKEPVYLENKEKIKDCDLVFIAVPTPTTPVGFNFDILKEVIGLAGVGKSVIIKSTMLPGTCEALQNLYPDRFIFHSPEFLTEKTAAADAARPTRNIVGYPIDNEEYHRRAQEILSVLPDSPLNMICRAREAELVKYASNGFLSLKVIYANILYDLAVKEGSDWEKIKAGIAADPRIGTSHLDPVHSSGVSDQVGRGAGGHCFIKDFAALLEYIGRVGDDKLGEEFLRAAIEKNLELLINSHKDREIIEEVYGSDKYLNA